MHAVNLENKILFAILGITDRNDNNKLWIENLFIVQKCSITLQKIDQNHLFSLSNNLTAVPLIF